MAFSFAAESAAYAAALPAESITSSFAAPSFPSVKIIEGFSESAPGARANFKLKVAVTSCDALFSSVVGDPGSSSALASTERGSGEESTAKQRQKQSDSPGQGWGWRRAGLADYIVVPVAAAGTLYFEHENGKPSRAKWTTRNDFDETFRDLFHLEKRAARDAARVVGDSLMALLIAAPVIDTFATLGIRDSRWGAAWQTSMINLEAFTFTSLASSLSQNLIAREKPYVRNCVDPNRCEEAQPNRSMPSGHVAFAFTGAGLLCTHHEYQSLYGNPDADRTACYSGLGLATATGIVRMMADGHYMTDVMAGSAIGLFSGFVLPRLLYYHHPVPRADRVGAEKPSPQIVFSPEIVEGGVILNCGLRF